MKKSIKIILYIFLFFTILPLSSYAQSSNVGFIPSNIWYSKDPFTEGDKIKIYTLLFNQDPRELSGEVLFYNKDTLLGKKSFALKSQESEVVGLDWTVTSGTHTIYAKIEGAKFLVGTGKYEEVTITHDQSEKSQKIVIKKITPDIGKIENDIKETSKDVLVPIKDIQEKIIENTPLSVSEPVKAISNNIDDYRISGLDYVTTKKVDIQSEIDAYKETPKTVSENKEETKTNTNKSSVEKPLKYLSLFFFTVLTLILKNKVIFYILCILVIFYVLRFVWRKIT